MRARASIVAIVIIIVAGSSFTAGTAVSRVL
jgi:hypothetical protein